MDADPRPSGELRVRELDLDENARHCRVVLDDGTAFELAPDAVEARGLAPGSLVDAPRLQALRFAAARKEVARELFRLLDRRPRCRSDLRERLVAKGSAPEVVDAVLDAAQEQGLVDDVDYARAWAHDQLLRKPVGRRWLLAKLQQQGVRTEDARAGLDALDAETDDASRALAALRTRRLDLEEEKQRAKGLRFLLSRGFDPSEALEALQRRRRELAAEAEG